MQFSQKRILCYSPLLTHLLAVTPREQLGDRLRRETVLDFFKLRYRSAKIVRAGFVAMPRCDISGQVGSLVRSKLGRTQNTF